jgi:hypothetical protein
MPLDNIARVQEHIRNHGAVVTRIDLYGEHLRNYYSGSFDSRDRVYSIPDSMQTGTPLAHAIALVGYNNEQQYWVAKNSWGEDWGDDGFFKVRQAHGRRAAVVALTTEQGAAAHEALGLPALALLFVWGVAGAWYQGCLIEASGPQLLPWQPVHESNV